MPYVGRLCHAADVFFSPLAFYFSIFLPLTIHADMPRYFVTWRFSTIYYYASIMMLRSYDIFALRRAQDVYR